MAIDTARILGVRLICRLDSRHNRFRPDNIVVSLNVASSSFWRGDIPSLRLENPLSLIIVFVIVIGFFFDVISQVPIPMGPRLYHVGMLDPFLTV